MIRFRIWLLLLGIGIVAGLSVPAQARIQPKALPINRPAQFTFESQSVLYADVSADGKLMAYAREDAGFTGIWLRSADPKVAMIPRRLTPEAGNYYAPAFSPDARFVAFVGTLHDAKGDIYLIDLHGETEMQRLTGRESADGGPCFSPDGKSLYFHQTHPGKALPTLATIDLASHKIAPLNIAVDGAFPAVSPDGSTLAFVSRSKDGAGDIATLDLASGALTFLSTGKERDLYPRWSTRGDLVYFTRGEAVPVVMRTAITHPHPWPVTSRSQGSYQPIPRADRLYFLSESEGIGNVWTVPLAGIVPVLANSQAQLSLAHEIAMNPEGDAGLSILGYARVQELFGKNPSHMAEAAYSMGRILEGMDFPDHAEQADLAYARGVASSDPLYSGLSLLAQQALQAEQTLSKSSKGTRHRQVKTFARQLIDAGDASSIKAVSARARVQAMRFFVRYGAMPQSLDSVLKLADIVLAMKDLPAAQAEALVLKGEAYDRAGVGRAVVPLYTKVVREYPEQDVWVNAAVNRLLDRAVINRQSIPERMATYMDVAVRNEKDLPLLSALAWNRMGDEYHAAGEDQQARSAYETTLSRFAQTGAPVVAARMALAEILYGQERFQRALDLYEKEMAERPYEDQIYRLARAAYMQRSAAAGQHLFRLGEVPAAHSVFAELERYEPNHVPAHRGLIQCSAALGTIEQTIATYSKRLKAEPKNSVLLYSLGLAFTYRDSRPDLEAGRDLITRAIAIQGQESYYHQTLGYVQEVLETVHGVSGGLEQALVSYRTARFLNDDSLDPRNGANLELNVGNACYLLGQYERALLHYKARLAAGHSFSNPETEIVFYQRMGRCAYQSGQGKEAAQAFDTALQRVAKYANPRLASLRMGELAKFITDSVLRPAMDSPLEKARGEKLSTRQSKLNSRTFSLGHKPLSLPPSAEWNTYYQEMNKLLAVQKKLVGEIVAAHLVEAESLESQSMQHKLLRVAEALEAPKRYVEMQAQLYDSLGLALQEDKQHAKARVAFKEAFDRNNALGRVENLAVNLRSAAFNAWKQAGQTNGLEQKRLLQQARSEFAEVVELVTQYGVPVRKKKASSSGALIDVNVQVALDDTAATQALDGFSAQQELRLAQTFIARIDTELGHIRQARAVLTKQVPATVNPLNIPANQQFGLGLAMHRQGHLAYGDADHVAAFGRFAHSAELSLAMQTASSAAVNVLNMAQSLRMAVANGHNTQELSLQKRFFTLAQRTSLLMKQQTDPGLIFPEYFNGMVVAFTDIGLRENTGKPGVASAVTSAYWLRSAMVAAHSASQYFTTHPPTTRAENALFCAVLANKARLAALSGGGVAHDWEQVLSLSQKALLPQFTWRALLALGRDTEALAALRTVPVTDLYAGQGEIVVPFAHMVRALVNEGRIEDAFDLAEELSELERVNRIAPLTMALPQGKAAALLGNIAPRILRLRELRSRLDEPMQEMTALQLERIQERIAQEQEILLAIMGAEQEHLPELARLAQTKDEQEWLLAIMGMAVRLEGAVATYSQSSSGRNRAAYEGALAAYLKTVERARDSVPLTHSPGVLGFILPRPVLSFDVMDRLVQGERLVRAFPSGDGGWILFTVSGQDIKAKLAATIPSDTSLLALEYPSHIPASFSGALSLSGTHFVQSRLELKPFKRRMVSLDAGNETIPSFFEKHDANTVAGENLHRELASAHTVILGSAIRAGNLVPVRFGQRAKPASVALLNGVATPWSQLVGLARNASAIITVPTENMVWTGRDATFEAASIASNFGIPSVGFVPSVDMARFLERYAEQPLLAAAKGEHGKGASSLIAGHPGLDSEEATWLARSRFAALAQRAAQEYKAGQFATALTAFEDCINIVQGDASGEYAVHLPQLYAFARTCAYKIKQMEAAQSFGLALVHLEEKNRPNSVHHAQAILHLGLVYAGTEEFDCAMSRLEEAVAMFTHLDMGPEQVRAMAELGTVLENAVRYTGALDSFSNAARVSDELMADDLLARQYMNLGRVRDLRLSQYSLAKQNYAKALEIYELLGDVQGIAQARLDIGRCDRLLGNFSQAEDFLQQGMDVLASQDDSLEPMKVRILLEQANNAWYQAKYQKAFELQQRVLQYARNHDWPLMRVLAENTAGMIWWTLGDHERALRVLERAEKEAHLLPVRKDILASVLNNKGLVLRHMGRYKQALSTLDAALKIDRKLQSLWGEAYDLRNIGQTYLLMGDADSAVDFLTTSLEIGQHIGNRINVAKTLVPLGQAYAYRSNGKDDERAKKSFKRALALSRSMQLREYEWRALHGLAGLQEQRGEKEKARSLLQEAVDGIETMRAEIRMEQLKDGFAKGKSAVYGDLVRLLADMEQEDEAFFVAERSRARNLIDLLGNQKRQLRGGLDGETYNEFQSLKARIHEQETLVAMAAGRKEQQVYARSLAQLQDRYTDLLLAVQANSPELASLVSVQPMTLQAVQQTMEADTALLVYYTTKNELFCWVVSPHSSQLVRTPVAIETLGQDILEYRRMLQNLEPVDIHGQRLHNTIIKSVLDKVLGGGHGDSSQVKAVGIIPHGPLHYLSFATLSDADSYLIERTPLFYLPSASVMRYTFARRSRAVSPRLLAVGNPDFGKPDLALPFAGHEVRSIAWTRENSTILRGAKATKSEVTKHMREYGIVHLATHGEFNTLNPMFSSIQFAPGEAKNGELLADEVFDLSLTTDLVVLSACQTGLGKVGAGDDVVGLNRSFLYAGTHALVSSLWRVSDVSTAILMKTFYREYPQSKKAKSLQRAMLHVRKQYAHPGYWGAFVLVGDYQ